MKHLLLDVNVVVDLSVQRSGTANAEIALSLAEYAGISIWVYAGSVQTLEYVTASELRALLANTGIILSRKAKFDNLPTDFLAKLATRG